MIFTAMKEIILALTYDDVLLVPQYSKVSSRNLVDLKTKLTPSFEIDFPVLAVNMDTVVGVEMAVAMSKYGTVALYPRFKSPKEQAIEVKQVMENGGRTIPAIGIKDEEIERVRALYEVGAKVMTIDVAHGHLDHCLNFLKKIKSEFKDLEVIAGVVATYEGAKDLFIAGADAVRVGVGPGTICTTRQVTGSGVPQITAIMEAAKAGIEFGKPIIADGGMKNSGDIAKALAAGASAAIVGSQLAGCFECPGEIIRLNGKDYKAYNGSTSKTEKEKQMESYAKDKHNQYTEYVEGIESLVPYKGHVKDVLAKLEKGIRSGLSYSGAFNIKEFHEKAQFIRVTPTSTNENGAHGVLVNKN
jgi:IMP dehydrogenase